MSVILFIAFFTLYSFIFTPQKHTEVILTPEENTPIQHSEEPTEIEEQTEVKSEPKEELVIVSESFTKEPTDLSTYGIRELRVMARQEGIKGFMKMKKAELIERLT